MCHLGGCGKECFKGKCATIGDDLMAGPLQVEETTVSYEVVWCHGSAGTPLRTHAGTEALGLQDARTAIRT
jgi:hypothetical protein